MTLIAGREADGKEGESIDWSRLPSGGTLVVYMGVARAGELARDLIGKAGFAGDARFAAVENGTRPGQRILRGRLSDLPRIAEEAGLRSPALLFVGAATAPPPRSRTGEDVPSPVPSPFEENRDGPLAKSV